MKVLVGFGGFGMRLIQKAPEGWRTPRRYREALSAGASGRFWSVAVSPALGISFTKRSRYRILDFSNP